MSAASEKAELRTRYRFERRERYLDHSFAHLATSLEFSKAQVIASYISYGDEPKTQELNASLLKNGKELYLPRVNGKSLDWVRWSGDKSELAPSKLSKEILEPTGPALRRRLRAAAISMPNATMLTNASIPCATSICRSTGAVRRVSARADCPYATSSPAGVDATAIAPSVIAGRSTSVCGT